MKLKIWEVYHIKNLIKILEKYNQVLYKNKHPYFIKKELLKDINLKILHAILDSNISGLKAIIHGKKIPPHLEYSYLRIYFLIQIGIFNNKKIANNIKISNLDIDNMIPIRFQKFLYWNLILEIFGNTNNEPLLRYVEKEMGKLQPDGELQNNDTVQEKFNKNLIIQLYSTILYSKTQEFLKRKNINLDLITFSKNKKYLTEEILFHKNIKKTFEIESDYLLKALYELFEQKQGFFFEEADLVNLAKKNKFISHAKN